MSEPEAITSAHAPDLDDVRRWLLQMVKAMRFMELVVAVIGLIARMRDLNTELNRRVAQHARGRPKSETLSRITRQLAFNFATIVGVSQESSADPESADAASVSAPKAKISRRGRHPGRAELPEHLERVPEVNNVPFDLRICPLCGSEMKSVGHTACEILDVRPAQLYVRLRLDETVACRNDDTIVSASTPAELVERGKLGTTLIIESLCDKYLEHQPIERQCLRWSRTGVDIAPQTLGRSVGAGIDLLSPVAKAIVAETRGPGLLATDATGIPVLDSDVPDGIRNGTMWCWTNARRVTFFYSPKGDSESVRRFLGDELARVVQCDGTNVTTFLERKGGQRPGCWSHGRRRFADSARVGDKIALEGLRIIGRLFAIERESASLGENAADRLVRRIAKSQLKHRSARRSATCIGNGPGSPCFSRTAISS